MGAPGEDVGSKVNAGAVTVLPAEAGCSDDCSYDVTSGTTLTQGAGGVVGTSAANNAFGSTVAGLPRPDLGIVVGAPGQNITNHPSAGSITVINPAPMASQQIHQDSPGVPGSAGTGDKFATLPRP